MIAWLDGVFPSWFPLLVLLISFLVVSFLFISFALRLLFWRKTAMLCRVREINKMKQGTTWNFHVF